MTRRGEDKHDKERTKHDQKRITHDKERMKYDKKRIKHDKERMENEKVRKAPKDDKTCQGQEKGEEETVNDRMRNNQEERMKHALKY